MSADAAPERGARAARVLAFTAPLAALAVAYRGAPGNELVGDAVPLIVENATMRAIRYLPAQVTHDYFWSSSPEAIGYWRPFTKASWLLETVLGGGAPPVYAIVQLAWLAVAIAALVALLLGAGVRPLVAGLAGLLLALHPAVVEPASLVMARSDVVACAAGLVAWLAFERALAGRRAAWAAHVAAFAVALASKEIAVALVAPLAVLAWARRGGVRAALPALAPAITLVLVYLVARRLVLGPGAGAVMDLTPLRLFVGAGRYVAALFPLRLETGLRSLALTEVRDPATIGAAALALAAAVALAVPALRARRALPLAAIAWAAASIALPTAVAEARVPGAAGKLALADRWLLPAVCASCMFFAIELDRLAQRWARPLAAAAVLAWAAASLAVSGVQRAPYRDGLSMLLLEDRQLEATPERFRTREDGCRALQRVLVRAVAAGDPDAALDAARRGSREGCPADVERTTNLLSVLLTAHRDDDALALVEDAGDAAVRGRAAPYFHHLAGIAYLRAGRPVDARAHLEEALRLGVSDCSALHALAATYPPSTAEAERARARAAGCRPRR